MIATRDRVGSPIYMTYRPQPKIDRKRVRVLPPLVTCAATVIYSIPNAGVHQREGEQVSGTSRPCDPAPGEDELGFWEALRATAHIRHHGSSSIQVRRCRIPSPLPPSASTRLHQRRRQQHRFCNSHGYFIYKRSVRAS